MRIQEQVLVVDRIIQQVIGQGSQGALCQQGIPEGCSVAALRIPAYILPVEQILPALLVGEDDHLPDVLSVFTVFTGQRVEISVPMGIALPEGNKGHLLTIDKRGKSQQYQRQKPKADTKPPSDSHFPGRTLFIVYIG